jgi:hypothetical protein
MECASSTRTTHGPDDAIMELDNMLANRQANSKTIDLSSQLCVHAVETIEDPIKMFGSNTQAMVAHTDLQHLVRLLGSLLNMSILAMGAGIFHSFGLIAPLPV